jgi:16S rRNA processing protein RimM
MGLTPNLILVGNLFSVYGLKGWIKIRSHTEPPENLFEYRPLLLNTVRGFETVTIDQWRLHNKGFVAKIVDIDDQQQAKSICPADIMIEKTHFLPLDPGKYYWHQLQGLRVISRFNADKTYLGTVARLISTGANDVLIVQGNSCSIDQRERLIPYVVDQYVKMVDLDNDTIYVEWDPEF